MGRYRLLVLCVVCLLGATACRPKPSKEFIQAQGLYEVLTTRDGDDAYDAPEMAAVVELLNKVSPTSKNAEQATALLAKIDAEKKRIAAEKDAARASAAAAKKPEAPFPTGAGFPAGSDVAAAGDPTAKPAEAVEDPPNGMPESVFTAKYAGCFETGPAMLPPGVTGKGSSQKLSATESCLRRFQGSASAETYFVFVDGKLNGRIQKTESKVNTPGKTVVIPGKTVTPPPPNTEVPGVPVYGVTPPKGTPGSPGGTADSPTGTPPPTGKDPWQQ